MCSLPQGMGHCFDMVGRGKELIDKKTRAAEYERNETITRHISQV